MKKGSRKEGEEQDDGRWFDTFADFDISAFGGIGIEDEDEDDVSADYEIDGFVAEEGTAEDLKARYLTPRVKLYDSKLITSDNAVKLAKELKLTKGARADVLLNGSFIYGDFIEAYLNVHDLKTERLIISTLSLSVDNVISLERLMRSGRVNFLDLIISNYFYSVENKEEKLIPVIYDRLDMDNRFQLAVAGSHTKITIFEDNEGNKIVNHGSANLRSSANIEQMVFEECPELYNFYHDALENIIDKYKTIDKKIIPKKQLFETIQRKRFND